MVVFMCKRQTKYYRGPSAVFRLYVTALTFRTHANDSTHHCTLNEMVGWSSPHVRGHKLILVFRAVFGPNLMYIISILTFNRQEFNLC